MEATAVQGNGRNGATYNVYAQDVDGAIRQLRKKERLDMMQLQRAAVNTSRTKQV